MPELHLFCEHLAMGTEVTSNQQKLSVRINWLYGIYNREFLLLFVNFLLCIFYVIKIMRLNTYIYSYIIFWRARY